MFRVWQALTIVLASVGMALSLASGAFWPTLVAMLALLTMHTTYWVWTHPINKIWLRDQDLRGPSARFFETSRDLAGRDWTELRDRLEYSHVVRAVLAAAALIALLVAALAP
jgi:hypothetical protein